MSLPRVQRPSRPGNLAVRVDGSEATLTWSPPKGAAPARYAVYRTVSADGPANLVATVPAAGAGEQRWVDRSGSTSPTYCVTALDRLWNESP
jgi:hypothetical protein